LITRAKPKIIGSARSTYTRVVCMVREEKRIAFVLTERPPGAPELLAIHLLGNMPVLRYGDVELFESKAIATISIAAPRPADLSVRSLPRRAHRAMGSSGAWITSANEPNFPAGIWPAAWYRAGAGRRTAPVHATRSRDRHHESARTGSRWP